MTKVYVTRIGVNLYLTIDTPNVDINTFKIKPDLFPQINRKVLLKPDMIEEGKFWLVRERGGGLYLSYGYPFNISSIKEDIFIGNSVDVSIVKINSGHFPRVIGDMTSVQLRSCIINNLIEYD